MYNETLLERNIKQKVARFIDKSSNLTWPDGFVDFDNQCFVVNGVKPVAHVQDEIESAFLWCWSVKDYLISSLDGKVSAKTIENDINQYDCLTICSDIANRLKHQNLRSSRSEKFAKLIVTQIVSINTKTISKIQRLDGHYFITPQNGECVKIKAKIVDQDGCFLFDAYECLNNSLMAWDTIGKKYE
ncbi:hypothetical protein [Photobacterium andalusiense]|uniref:Uncharacterized protein n=1 Tax=Photobacterium andalusiense TaxID=2204296 RepID=A0A1Y6MHS3_9GAMM|nr:hypothetical protein [Photobacterium andalusiense]SMY36135.1 hypothetical protein PAND9192_02464 [Photobacterium andalusiense]